MKYKYAVSFRTWNPSTKSVEWLEMLFTNLRGAESFAVSHGNPLIRVL